MVRPDTFTPFSSFVVAARVVRQHVPGDQPDGRQYYVFGVVPPLKARPVCKLAAALVAPVAVPRSTLPTPSSWPSSSAGGSRSTLHPWIRNACTASPAGGGWPRLRLLASRVPEAPKMNAAIMWPQHLVAQLVRLALARPARLCCARYSTLSPVSATTPCTNSRRRRRCRPRLPPPSPTMPTPRAPHALKRCAISVRCRHKSILFYGKRRL